MKIREGNINDLKELQKRGYKTVPEIARELIKEQKEINGEALPWKIKELYLKVPFKGVIK